MVNDTSIARGVRSVANDYDTACKRLLSERQVLSRILHEWLHEFAETDPHEIERECLEGEPRIGEDRVDRDEAAAARVLALQEEDATQDEGCTTFDIRFEARLPGIQSEDGNDLIRIEMNIEAQNDFHPGYPLLKRGIYYCGRLLSKKLNILHDRYGIIVTNNLRERVNSMCNLSEGILNEGVEKGRSEGLKEGRSEGLKEGRDETRREFLRPTADLVREGVYSLQEAARRFGFTEQELASAL